MLLHSPARRGDPGTRPAPFGPGDPASVLDTLAGRDRLLAWFRARYAGVSAATWNANRAALCSACAFWVSQGWLTGNPAEELETRGVTRGAPRARPREEIEVLLGCRDIPARERALWTLLYESAARVHEVLELNVEDLDLDNRRAQVGRKGGAADVIMWGPQASGLLRRYLGKRTRGPVFLTDRRAKRNLDLGPRRRLSRHRPGPPVLPPPRRSWAPTAGAANDDGAVAVAVEAWYPGLGSSFPGRRHSPAHVREGVQKPWDVMCIT